MKSKLEIYALSVCFTSVLCLVISLGIGSYALVSINAPSLTMNSYLYNQHQSNETYWKSINRPCHEKDCKETVKPEEKILTEQREIAFSMAKKNEVRQSLQVLIKSGLFILFSALALFIHWRIARNSREL